MLTHLLIKNYALIKHLEINPDPGLSIITGETGAGKSIMLGALGLLMGNRADVKALFDEEEKCVIEGTFDLGGLDLKPFFEAEELDYEPVSLIRREISPAGKSRAFINDTPVNLETLKSLGSLLMDIHSQHDTMMLGSNAYQLQIIDFYLQNQQQLSGYKESYSKFKKAEKAYNQLLEESGLLKKEFDYNSFLYEELVSANLVADEQELLEEELTILEHAEEVKQKLKLTYDYLNNPDLSIISMLKDSSVALNPIVQYADSYRVLKERLQNSLIELQDVSEEIEKMEGKIEVNDEQVIFLKDRLNLLFRLHQKHAVRSNAELIGIREELKIKVENVLNLSEKLSGLEKQKAEAYEQTLDIARKISEGRKAVLPQLEKEIVSLLVDLGIPDAALKISHSIKEPGAEGIDEIKFEFSANKGVAPKSLKEVASGGEFSRLMLAIKYILAGKRVLPTLIFDEIDTGISGQVSIKVGKMMKDMAKNLQVLAITHLHQIAGRGDSHFYVYKDNSEVRTVSKMKKLNDNERILEIAKMIGGESPSDSAIQSAIEMLGIIN
ncbi:DNA repair protein RecN [Emticicia sp. CRIBPO]|uniref:DNA repair protein RecN n=1 Tax=Emticicia sp. CRIBPO TaxID=2683258 RepID=UPI00141358C4|nr:DNA repair protein RecN [Emticicia sp. CRIBPO]NBA87956.1 DNA repair protein RecN [Emticicia sp. CRIBPO]